MHFFYFVVDFGCILWYYIRGGNTKQKERGANHEKNPVAVVPVCSVLPHRARTGSPKRANKGRCACNAEGVESAFQYEAQRKKG